MWETLFFILMILCLVTLSVGVWLLFRPYDSNEKLKSHYKEALPWLFHKLRVERFVYRHHVPVGLAIMGGALFILFAEWNLHLEKLFGINASEAHVKVSLWFYQSLTLIFLVGALFALVLGWVIMVRPSSLKSFESWANTHLTGEMLRRWLQLMRTVPVRYVESHPRYLAVFIILGSLFAVFKLSQLWPS